MIALSTKGTLSQGVIFHTWINVSAGLQLCSRSDVILELPRL